MASCGPWRVVYKTIIYDENSAATTNRGKRPTVELKDKRRPSCFEKETHGKADTGILIGKHDTYYIYDNYGNFDLCTSKMEANHSINYNNKWSIERFLHQYNTTTNKSPCGEKVTRKTNGVYSL
jgi:hypothetical protein